MKKTIKLENGIIVELQGDPLKYVYNGGSLLGKGGEGSVYLVKNPQTDDAFALKIYHRPISEQAIANLKKVIECDAPDESFLWPISLTEPLGKDMNLRGYIMPLFNGKEFISLSKILKGKVKFISKEKELVALMSLSKAIERLHAKGLQLTDINDSSVLFDIENGKVLICDTGNICPLGSNSEMLGKIKYAAPEVLSRYCTADKYSDLFSLAVLLFLVLTHAHPLDGIRRLEEGPLTFERQERLYAKNPIFIFNPTDDSNRPDEKIDVNAIQSWSTLPEHIKSLFIKTFTNGMPADNIDRESLLKTREKRTTAKEWANALEKWISESKGSD